MKPAETLRQQIQSALGLAEARLGGSPIDMRHVEGEVEVIRLTVGGREELPIFVTRSDTQTLCICYLWEEAQIDPAQRTGLLEALLDLTIPMPLSSFGRIGEHYVVFGALSCDAGAEDIAEEIVALSDNAVDALDALSGYLL